MDVPITLYRVQFILPVCGPVVMFPERNAAEVLKQIYAYVRPPGAAGDIDITLQYQYALIECNYCK